LFEIFAASSPPEGRLRAPVASPQDPE